MRQDLQPTPDFPGTNTKLKPAARPPWLAPLVDDVTDGRILALAKRRLGISLRGHAASDKRAAVLMLFSGDPEATTRPDDAGIVITHRSPQMRTHAGQMAFPGGRCDDTDTNVVDTALREGWEEVGIDRRTLTPLACMNSVHVKVNTHPIHPVIAYWNEPTRLRPTSLEETDDVYLAPLADLIDPKNRLLVRWGNFQGPAFRSNGYLIWGLTAALLDATIVAAGWEVTWSKRTVHDLAKELAASRNQEIHR